ncbi:MAG: serine/threonine protein kinase [Phycisphaeraceae bacterium]|nr:MAG: serine/threonine protein kinase [Phycisphaeraceae bacterium]
MRRGTEPFVDESQRQAGSEPGPPEDFRETAVNPSASGRGAAGGVPGGVSWAEGRTLSREESAAMAGLAPNAAAPVTSGSMMDSFDDPPEDGGPMRLPKVEGYSVVRRLGRGGMGVVFEGVQESTGRRVAIKFLLGGSGGSEASRKRFEREIEVVAGLSHPGIVSVIDSGVRKGRYFYVMEYVDGRPLDEAVRPGACGVGEALELVSRVCDAVDYAHQRGVLHRDLKPSNILIDGGGAPHLLDFGLAKRTDDSESGPHGHMGLTVSEPGQLLGTVAYMSPEQSLGRAAETSVRSDVYSLGVIAYELVTGRLPVGVEGSLREVLTRIAEAEPAAPSVVRAGVSRDLDAVLLRALEKAPARRYATAADLAEDLRRYLSGRPVEARHVGAAGRAWRWVKRNRALSAVAGSAAVVLAGVSAGLIVRIVQERDRANENADAARTALAASVASERQSKENFALLKGILESADPERAGELTVRQLLDGATTMLDAQPPELGLTEAAVRETLGLVYRKFGDYGKAERHLRRALELREAGGDEVDASRAEVMHHLAAVLWWRGSYDEAEPLYRASLAARRRLHPGDHRETAVSLTHLASCRLKQGDMAEAGRLGEEALEMRRRLFGAEHEEVAQSLNNLAKTRLEAGDLVGAEALFRDALRMIAGLRGEHHAGTAAASQNLALCLLERGDAAGARDAFARSGAVRAMMYIEGHHLLADSLVGEAKAELALGGAARAEELAWRGVEMYERTGRAGFAEHADALVTLGMALSALGRDSEAVEQFERAMPIAREVESPAGVLVAEVLSAWGECDARAGRTDGAGRKFEESLALLKRAGGDRSRRAVAAASRLVRFEEERAGGRTTR